MPLNHLTTQPPNHPEHRRCPVTGRWTIVAPERGGRPIELADSNPHARRPDPGGFCPFCPGCEWDTPGEVYAVRPTTTAPDSPGWSLRVVPNRFPAVRPDAPDGYGFHEVLIDTPRHITDPADLTAAETLAGLIAVRERVRVLAAQPDIRHVAVFRNVGASAGASLAHSHAQLLAIPYPPPDVVAEPRYLRTAPERHAWPHAEHTDGCPTCDLEICGPRDVASTHGFVAACPPAGQFDHEVWLIPTRCVELSGTTDAELERLAGLLRRMRRTVAVALGRPAYNEIIRTGPGRHWRLELLPRTATLAGFELGTGCHILTVTPERSAELLRAALPPEDDA